MSTLSSLWKKLTNKKYREAFVSSQLKRGIPFQIRSLRKQCEMSQEELAEKSGLTQGVISRAEDPDYGNLTFNTVLRIAAGFDVAFIGKFVPFSELGKWFIDLSEESVQVLSFPKDKLESLEPSKTGIATATQGRRPVSRVSESILGQGQTKGGVVDLAAPKAPLPEPNIPYAPTQRGISNAAISNSPG